MRQKLVGALIVALAAFQPFPSYAAPMPRFTVTASAMKAEFKANSVFANRKYKDMVIKIIGPIAEIKERTDGTMFVGLKTGDKYAIMTCNFPEGYNHNVGKLKVGANATIIGVFMGRISLFGVESYGFKECFIP